MNRWRLWAPVLAKAAPAVGWYLVVVGTLANWGSLLVGSGRPFFSAPTWAAWSGAALVALRPWPHKHPRPTAALIGWCLLQWSILCNHWPAAVWAAAPAGAAAIWQARGRRGPPGAVTIGRTPLGRPCRLSSEERWLHTHVVGPTGCGKSSSVLWPLIQQDLAHGHGLALIEPKGDLAATVRRRALDVGRTVVCWDPGQPDCPRFNPLDGDPAQAAEGLSWALNQFSAAGHPFYATLSRVQLMFAVLAIKEVHQAAADLPMVLRFLSQSGFREDTLAAVHDPATLSYFGEQLGGVGARTAHEQRQGLVHRLQLLLVNPRLRAVFTGPADFTLDDVLARNWVLVAPLSLAHFGESAHAAGTLLWHQLAQAAYRRGAGAPFFLYLDEFHQYVTPDLGHLLAMARGYHLGLVLAHQDMGQLDAALGQAVLANARQRIVFGGLPPADVERFTAGAPAATAARLRYLPRGWAMVQLTRSGRPTPLQPVRLLRGRLDPLAAAAGGDAGR